MSDRDLRPLCVSGVGARRAGSSRGHDHPRRGEARRQLLAALPDLLHSLTERVGWRRYRKDIFQRKGQSGMKRIGRVVAAAALVAAGVFGASAQAFANATPPTNGGNGGGHSGQCTGSVFDRPAGCHTSK